MNKQQLASRIWESANNMRSKIEANEYKDYILGFIFYKFLSDKEETNLRKDGWNEDNLKEYLKEENTDIVKNCQNKNGYFISYNNLFSTWLKKGNEFDVSDVRDALSAFTRLVGKDYQKLFEKIFDTLDTGLSKLGDNSGTQTKAIRSLIELINPIPMDGKQGYDVLGFIYEYLIGMFAANAGKKAGEFYTPHEVSLVMSQIVANHLKDRDEIEIYDPTSGSGSLLINIGQSIAKYLKDKDKIKYYVQELKENTYSLTRMNLIMRGIKPANIVARNGDTLAEDWPYFEDGHKETTYEFLSVDAVVSNPPYSQRWEPKEDPRFSNYGVAPKTKADYAFLLHDLYHLKQDGIMTIVLPHGVLFRGNEEGNIRRNLIELDNIDAIIGLPANIFFGTGIPTIIMVLKKKKNDSNILFVDASKDFIKVGKNNKLRACDIKKIVDVVVERKTIEKYSRIVSKEEIRKNDYNLNIPRYVDSSEKADSYDLYASMFGGIPNYEIDECVDCWSAFPSLKSEIFEDILEGYSQVKTDDVQKTILDNLEVKQFISEFEWEFSTLGDELKEILIEKYNQINIQKCESEIADNIFKRLEKLPLLNKYDAYQILDDNWQQISIDIEMLQSDGLNISRAVDPNMVTKKKDNKEVEVQNGWVGRIIPFWLIHNTILKEQAGKIKNMVLRLEEISGLYIEKIESLTEEEKEEIVYLLNDENDAFVNAKITSYVKSTTKNPNLICYTCHQTIVEVGELLEEEKTLKKQIKSDSSNLEALTKKTIENLSNTEIKSLLFEKWISPLMKSLKTLPNIIINNLQTRLVKLSKKYENTFIDINKEISTSERHLVKMIDDLNGEEYDLIALKELQKILGGE